MDHGIKGRHVVPVLLSLKSCSDYGSVKALFLTAALASTLM